LYQRLLRDTSFYDLLLRLDEESAEEVRTGGCPCGGRLHQSHYWRKPRGGPDGLCRQMSLRFSFCCSVEGCRRRRTPPSLRFLDRKVFFSVVVVLVPLLREGSKPRRLQCLQKVLQVSARTVRRWQRWWRESFAQSPRLTRVQGLCAEPIEPQELPGSLVRAFGQVSVLRDQILAVLRVLVCEDRVHAT
jgi:hypothetical protein